jgi:hypothetical protein
MRFASHQPGAIVVFGIVVGSQLQPALPGRYPHWLPRRLSYCQLLRINAERQAPKALPGGFSNGPASFETAAMPAAACSK